MNHYYLDEEEQQELDTIENALEKGEVQSVSNWPEEKKRLEQIARNSMNKTRNINIRLSERDVHKLKTKAAEEGIPYQTLAASILHKGATR